MIIGTGFAGGYTTLSHLGVGKPSPSPETGDLPEASLNILASFAAGLAAASAGLGLAPPGLFLGALAAAIGTLIATRHPPSAEPDGAGRVGSGREDRSPHLARH